MQEYRRSCLGVVMQTIDRSEKMLKVACTIPHYDRNRTDEPTGMITFKRGWNNFLPDFFVVIEIDGKEYHVAFRDFWTSAKSCASL